MRIAVVARSKDVEKEFANVLQSIGATISEKNPQVVFSFGGDGTFLVAERTYPQIPKIMYRVPRGHPIPKLTELKSLYAKLIKKQYRIAKHDKLEALINAHGKKYVFECANDFVVRNTLPTHAVRFSLSTGEMHFSELVGDGVVLSTSYGSSAYFYSITRKTFEKGIGLAFNNLHRKQAHGVLPENSRIRIVISRGPAVFCADNDKRYVHLREGDSVVVHRAKSKLRVVEFL